MAKKALTHPITTKKEKHREHNHFTMGKTGYDPKFARFMSIEKKKKEK